MTEYMTLFIVKVSGAAYKTETEKCIKNTAYEFCSTQSNPLVKQHSMLFPSNSNKGFK